MSKKQSPKEDKKIIALEENEVLRKIYDMRLKGKSYREIAVDLDMTDAAVHDRLNKAIIAGSRYIEKMKENHTSLTYDRTEYLLGRLFEYVEGEEIIGEGENIIVRKYINTKVIKSITDLMKIQDVLLNGKRAIINNQTNEFHAHYEPTFVSSSDFYAEALEDMQDNYLADGLPELPEYASAEIRDDRLDRIEAVISKIVGDDEDIEDGIYDN